MKSTSKMVGNWELSRKTIPVQFLSFAEAYLDSACRLCKILKRSTRKRTYPRSAVVLYLAFHSVELFLKAAILNKSPNDDLGHDIKKLSNRYRNLYPGKKYNFEIPFGTEYLGFEPPDKLPTPPPQDQTNRYPIDKKYKEWEGSFGFIPETFLITLEVLQRDFERIKRGIYGYQFYAADSVPSPLTNTFEQK